MSPFGPNFQWFRDSQRWTLPCRHTDGKKGWGERFKTHDFLSFVCRNPETVHGGGEVQAAESFNDGELTLPTKPPTAVLK
ncbi:hypothetical protein MCOR02_011244 [Pyricularia oryzae]|nr:hypothetical protein MCOR02_011244 [Pyricularia oryzae]